MIVELVTCKTKILLELTFAEQMHLNVHFFSYSISESSERDPELCNAKAYSTFRKSLVKFGRPNPNHVYKTRDPFGLELLTRLRLGLSQLDEHRFNHNFDSCINPLCFCSLKVESPK